MAATLSNEDILEAISNKSVMEVCQLIEAMEQKFGVSAAAAVTVAAPAAATAAEEEQTEFSVILKATGDNKINVIKVVREITSLGLKEAKDAVDGAPKTLKEGVSKEQAAEFKKKLEAAGAQVEVK